MSLKALTFSGTYTTACPRDPFQLHLDSQSLPDLHHRCPDVHLPQSCGPHWYNFPALSLNLPYHHDSTEWSLNFAWLVVSFTRPDPNSKWWISFLTQRQICVITMNLADDLDSWLKPIISGSALLRICRMGSQLARSLSSWLYYRALLPVPQVAARLQWSLTLYLVWIFFVVTKDNSFSWLRMFLLADSAPRAV